MKNWANALNLIIFQGTKDCFDHHLKVLLIFDYLVNMCLETKVQRPSGDQQNYCSDHA